MLIVAVIDYFLNKIEENEKNQSNFCMIIHLTCLYQKLYLYKQLLRPEP